MRVIYYSIICRNQNCFQLTNLIRIRLLLFIRLWEDKNYSNFEQINLTGSY